MEDLPREQSVDAADCTEEYFSTPALFPHVYCIIAYTCHLHLDDQILQKFLKLVCDGLTNFPSCVGLIS